MYASMSLGFAPATTCQGVAIPLREKRSPSCWCVPTSVAPAAISTRRPFSMPSSADASSAAFRVYVMTGVPSASTLTWPELSSRMTTHSVTVRENRAILSLKSAAAATMPRCPWLKTREAAGMCGGTLQERRRLAASFLIDRRIRRQDGALVASSCRSTALRKVSP